MHPLTYYKIENPNPLSRYLQPSGMISYKETKHKTGLMNLGNTCFLNSILQCLHSVIPFNDYLLSSDFQKRANYVAMFKISAIISQKLNIIDSKTNSINIDETKDKLLSYQLFKLFKSLEENHPVIRPVSFVHSFLSKHSTFTSGAQGDSHEALKCILDTVHEELSSNVVVNFPCTDSKIINLQKQKQDFLKILRNKKATNEQKKLAKSKYLLYKSDHMDTYLILQSYKYWKKHLEKYKCSKITELFDGTILGSTYCKDCKNVSYMFTPNRFLALPIPDSSSRVSLYDCFKLYCNPETLDDSNKYKCTKCEKLVNATRELCIWEPPTILIIQLVRFVPYSSGYRKNHTEVCYPLELNVYPYVSNIASRSSDSVNYNYELFAISNHFGEYGGGHYTAFGKDNQNNWFEYNDASAVPILVQKALSNQFAYVLFYKHKKIDK